MTPNNSGLSIQQIQVLFLPLDHLRPTQRRPGRFSLRSGLKLTWFSVASSGRQTQLLHPPRYGLDQGSRVRVLWVFKNFCGGGVIANYARLLYHDARTELPRDVLVIGFKENCKNKFFF